MRIKSLSKYEKLVVVFAIIGFVGAAAYLIVREMYVEDTTVTVYEVGDPIKPEYHSNRHLASGHSPNRATKTIESSGSSITSETPLTNDYTGEVEVLDGSGKADLAPQDVEISSADSYMPVEGSPQYRPKYSHVQGYIVDRDELVRRFGDFPQVHTAYEYLRKASMGKEKTTKEEIAGIEALKYLYPELHTPVHEEFLQALKEDRVIPIGQLTSPELFDAINALQGATLSPEMYEALKNGRLPLYGH